MAKRPDPDLRPCPPSHPFPAALAALAVLALALVLAGGACAGAGPHPQRAGRAGVGRAPGPFGEAADRGGQRARAGRAGADEVDNEQNRELRSLLLLLVDRKTYEPLIVRRCLAGPPPLRRELAAALGRAGDPRALDPLLGLLLDDEVEVQRAAAFAIGDFGERLDPKRLSDRRRAAGGLLDAVAGPDREVGTLAVEALGKLGVTVEQVLARMKDLEPAERWARLLPSLYRFPDPQTPGLALQGLDLEDPALVEWAAYALTVRPQASSLETIRALAADPPSPRVAAWAARALGTIGRGGDDLKLLRPMLDGSAPAATIEALHAARSLISSGRVAAPDAWRDRLVELASDPRPGVRLTALDAASAWLLDDRLGTLLAERVRSDAVAAERGAALVALASGGDPRAEELTAAAARSDQRRLRARAAEAAGLLGATAILDRLAGDAEPMVRQAVLAVRLAAAGHGARGAAGGADPGAAGLRWVEQVLPGLPAQPAGTTGGAAPSSPPSRASGGAQPSAGGDPDPGVRAVALHWLAEHPLLPVKDLETPLVRSLGGPVTEERMAALDAIVARVHRVAGSAPGSEAGSDAGAEPGTGSEERETATAMLLEVAGDADFATREPAAAGLASLGLDRPAVGAAESERSSQVYGRILDETGRPRTVEIRTERGDVQVRLDCPEAPLTCLNFLQLADQGFYDGLTFHRVVPGSVVQGGDPRGDGWGGPGFAIRDELGRLRFGDAVDGGILGMAEQRPDTAGSQFFLTLAPRPDLDGKFTAFGEVVEGREVLDHLLPGDRIESVREIGGADGEPVAPSGRSGRW